MKAEYIPYGTEWRKEMNQFTKADLIDHLRVALIKKQNPESAQLTENLTKSLLLLRGSVSKLRESHHHTRNKLEQFVILESITHLIDVENVINSMLAEDDDE